MVAVSEVEATSRSSGQPALLDAFVETFQIGKPFVWKGAAHMRIFTLAVVLTRTTILVKWNPRGLNERDEPTPRKTTWH